MAPHNKGSLAAVVTPTAAFVLVAGVLSQMQFEADASEGSELLGGQPADGGFAIPRSCQFGKQGVRLTPACLADAVAGAPPSPSAGDSEVPHLADADALLAQARKLASPMPPLISPDSESLYHAKQKYLELIEHSPTDADLRGELGNNVYARLYDPKKRGSLPRNLTAAYLDSLDAIAARGYAMVDGRRCKARRLSKNPPVFTVDDFLSPDEVSEVVAKYYERRALFRRAPRVCFQIDNAEYVQYPGLKEHLQVPSGQSSRSCLSQQASAAVHRVAEPTYSYSAHSGPDNGGIRDRVSAKLQAVAGLHEKHAFKMQLLGYGTNSSYGEHVDCTEKKLHSVNRAATVLVYLTDDTDGLEGGETVFPRALDGPLSVRPKRGMAVFFYSFDGQKCSHRSNHLAEVVRAGTKLVMQRWYSYAEDAFNAEDGTAPTLADHKAWQPYVSCDYVGVTPAQSRRGAKKKVTRTLSCRWFDHPSFEFRVAPDVKT